MARCCAKNFWDNCLEDQASLQRQITFPCLCTLPPGLKNKLPWEEQDETGAYPVQSKPWNTLGGIVTPLTAAGDQVVCSFKVPLGYDALFSGMFMGYSGSGYQQGSGDIVWRILVNIHYPDELGNIGYIYGTPQEPLPLTEGQIVFSNSTISLVVNVPNLSGNIQVGASRVFGGLLGFMWLFSGFLVGFSDWHQPTFPVLIDFAIGSGWGYLRMGIQKRKSTRLAVMAPRSAA